MTALKKAQQRIAELEHHLARCRDAFHTPPTGPALDDLWRSATQTPDGIPAFVEAAMQAGGEPVAYLWQHSETGRTRVVMPDMIVDTDASWYAIGPMYLGKAHPPSAQDAERKPLGFFAMSDDFGFERHSTAQGARASANAMLSELRDSAQSGEWPMESESVCWGAIFEQAAETEVIEDCCDYVLQGAAIAAQQGDKT